jgi:acid phosphatase type 7
LTIGKTKICHSKPPVFIGTVILLLGVQAAATSQTPGQPSTKKARTGPHKVTKKQPKEQEFILVGAGDIASCKDPEGARATANLIEQIPGTVFAAGDLAYESGSPVDFKNCYDPGWGRFKERTKPALGNHEYADPTAKGYFDYWGAQAGPRGKGYYSYDLGAWHIVVLNTNCNARGLGGCGRGSPQETWLKADLAEHPRACLLSYGHYALFSSGIFKNHAIHPELKQLWEDLYAAHADLVLAGHEHSYERFAPQDPEGHLDPEKGIREIVTGTGGRSHGLLGFATPNREVRDWETYGVLKLTLSSRKYSWEFIPEENKRFRGSAEGTCHNSQPAN